jgi:predicted nucleotidyltransferase
MSEEPFSWRPIFEALNERGVRYVIVGGLAVVLHGHPRLTGDVDLMVDLAEEEARKTVSALTGIGLQPGIPVDPADFADASARRGWIGRNMVVLNFCDASTGRSVDLFVENPLAFEDVWARSEVLDYRGVPVRVASIPDLIELKRRAGRPEDLFDISQLLKLQRLREGKGGAER